MRAALLSLSLSLFRHMADVLYIKRRFYVSGVCNANGPADIPIDRTGLSDCQREFIFPSIRLSLSLSLSISPHTSSRFLFHPPTPSLSLFLSFRPSIYPPFPLLPSLTTDIVILFSTFSRCYPRSSLPLPFLHSRFCTHAYLRAPQRISRTPVARKFRHARVNKEKGSRIFPPCSTLERSRIHTPLCKAWL